MDKKNTPDSVVHDVTNQGFEDETTGSGSSVYEHPNGRKSHRDCPTNDGGKLLLILSGVKQMLRKTVQDFESQ
jgi:hypothetical protein